MRLITFLIALLVSLAAFSPLEGAADAGQTGKRHPPPQARPHRPNHVRPPGPSRNPGSVLERWQRMSPQQRQRALEKLSPERRRSLERRLRRLQNLSPEQRRRLQRDYQRFRRLSPEQQKSYRRLYGRFNKLPPNRRQSVNREFRNLRRLSPQQRRERLSSDQFRNSFSTKERQLLEEMVKMLPVKPPKTRK